MVNRRRLKLQVWQEDTKGEWRWRIRSSNGKIMAESGESYGRRHSMMKSLRSLGDHLHADLYDVEEN